MTRPMQVLDALLRQFTVRHNYSGIVPCAYSRGTPIDVDDLALCSVIQLNPITKPKRMLNAERNAGKQITQCALQSKSD